MTTRMTDVAKNLNADRISASMYPMAHFGQIWQIPGGNTCIWEIIKLEESRNQQVASGLADSIRDAQEAMQGAMSLWVSYGSDYTADRVSEDIPPPPMGFVIPNMD